MIKEHLFSKIEGLNDKYVEIWRDVCNIESPTLHKAGVDAVGNYFADVATSLGFSIERLPLKTAGDVVVITMNPDSENPPICFSGHTDTVHPLGSFGTPAVKIEDGKIYGPGVTDCKGGIVAALLAMESLLRVGYTARPIMLLLQSDEEMGSRPSEKASINYICEKAKGARAFFNLEPGNDKTAVLTRKGITVFTFNVKGKSAHASRSATEGASAILEAAHKIIECEKLKDKDGITANCGIISGGTVPNTVPDSCVFKADVRFVNEDQRDYAVKYMEELAKTSTVPGTECTLTYSKGRPPMIYSETNKKLLDDINEIYKENGMSPLEPSSATGGSDAAYVTMAEIPCLDNFGAHGGHIHSPEEYAHLSSLTAIAKRLALAAYYL